MKQKLRLFMMTLLCAVCSAAWSQEEVTIASMSSSSYDGWTITANLSSSNPPYFLLTSSDVSIVSPSIDFSSYTDITITIKARKYGGPDATQGKISVSQGTSELTSYSPSNTTLTASSPLSITPSNGTITISCPGASNNKGCGVSEITIKGKSASGVVKPTFSPAGGIYTEPQTVTISAGEGATIYYTLDGTDPDDSSSEYTGTISITETTTLKAIAYVGDDASAVTSATYTINTPPADYATLPFSFNSGSGAIASTAGLTQSGLGDDYSDATCKLKLDNTGDYVILHFNETPGKLSFNIKGNGFSGGTFKVQTSTDGETYSDLKEYTSISGNNNGQAEEFTLNENVRYIKWIYTTKSSGNVGLGNIKLEKYVAPQSYTLTITPNDKAEIFVFYKDNYNDIQSGDEVLATSEVLVSVSVEDEDYELDFVTVTDGDGLPVQLTEEEEGISWTFIMPSSDVTVACMVKEKEKQKPTEKWVKTNLADLTEDDIFVIVGNNGDNYALPNDISTTPSAISVMVFNDMITTPVTDNIKWNVSGNANDGYIFYPNSDKENWLYLKDKSTNKGVFIGTGDHKLFTLSNGYLYNEETERYVGIYNSSDWRCYTSTSTNISGQTFAFYKLLKATINIKSEATDGETCYATISELGENKNFVVKGEGIQVHTLMVSGGKIKYEQTWNPDEILPGNGAYLVVGPAGKYSFPETSEEPTYPVGENMLRSTGEKAVDEDYAITAEEMKEGNDGDNMYYKLSLRNGKIGFYWGTEGGGAFNYSTPHQAYLVVPLSETPSANANAIYFDGTTGIDAVKDAKTTTGTVHTLSGIRVDGKQLPKGIYIVDGKKIVVK